MPTDGRRAERNRVDLGVFVVFVVGLALSLLLAFRSQVGGDQLNLLARGWLLVARGEWVPYGNPASTGGAVPGGLTALVVGAPLALWSHHRAALLGVLLTQVIAFFVLDRWAAAALGWRQRLLFAIFYWLNPWRLLLSGFLWNPGYLLLVGALHLWCCWRQRAAGRFGASMTLALALGLGVQLHPGAILLGVATVGLLAARRVRLRWSGIIAGAVVALVPLVPWVVAVREHSDRLPISEGYIGRGLLLLFPVRGANYWVRYATFHLPAKEMRFDFTTQLDPGALTTAADALAELIVKGIGPVSYLAGAVATVWLWRRWRRGWRRLLVSGDSACEWTLAYLRLSFLGSLVVYALAPTTVMWWQAVSLLHAAALTLTLAAGALARRRARLVRTGAVAWAGVSVVLATLLAFGGPRHRCGGRSNVVIPLSHDHPMLHELGIHASCPVPIEAGTWWPDVLPEGGD